MDSSRIDGQGPILEAYITIPGKKQSIKEEEDS
jgi:hypothetical protein